MATTKQKPAQKVAPKVAPQTKAKQVNEDPEVAIETAIGKTGLYIYNNGKKLFTILVAALLVIGGIMAYKYIYVANRSENAAAMMYVAEQSYIAGMYDVALEGDGVSAGFLDVISKYGSTPVGNLAKHYTGLSYMKLGDTESALNYLGEYDPAKGIPGRVVAAQNYGLQGDILADMGEYDNAAGKYEKAVGAGENSLTTPLYLKKLGLAYLKLGKGAKAEDAFQRVIDEYPTSAEAREALKYLGAAQQLQ